MGLRVQQRRGPVALLRRAGNTAGPAERVHHRTGLAAGFPDWVSQTEQTDRDAVSTGCSIVYIYWMRSLGFTTPQIVQAAGATLSDNYQSLTSQASAYQDLVAAVSGMSVTSDNDDQGSAVAGGGLSSACRLPVPGTGVARGVGQAHRGTDRYPRGYAHRGRAGAGAPPGLGAAPRRFLHDLLRGPALPRAAPVRWRELQVSSIHASRLARAGQPSPPDPVHQAGWQPGDNYY